MFWNTTSGRIPVGRLSVLNTRRSFIRRNQTTTRGTLGEGQKVIVGQYAEKAIRYEQSQVNRFAFVVEDFNPLHFTDCTTTTGEEHPLQGAATAAASPAESTKPVVHGMLVASIFSSIFGSRIPGSVYLDQTLRFTRPVHIGDELMGRIQVTRVRHLKGKCLVACDTTVHSADDDSIVYIRGKATVWVP